MRAKNFLGARGCGWRSTQISQISDIWKKVFYFLQEAKPEGKKNATQQRTTIKYFNCNVIVFHKSLLLFWVIHYMTFTFLLLLFAHNICFCFCFYFCFLVYFVLFNALVVLFCFWKNSICWVGVCLFICFMLCATITANHAHPPCLQQEKKTDNHPKNNG